MFLQGVLNFFQDENIWYIWSRSTEIFNELINDAYLGNLFYQHAPITI